MSSNEMRGDKDTRGIDQGKIVVGIIWQRRYFISLLLEKINAFTTTNTSISNKKLGLQMV